MDPRVARSRAAIVDATVASVLESGVDGASIEDICARSGVARTTVYRHWDSKPELVLDALSRSLRPPRDPDTGTLRDDLLMLVGGFASALSDGPLARLMATMVEAATRDERFAKVHHAEVQQRHGVVRGVVERGIDRGELPQDTDVDDVLAAVLGPIVYRALVAMQPVSSTFVAATVDRTLIHAARASTAHAAERP